MKAHFLVRVRHRPINCYKLLGPKEKVWWLHCVSSNQNINSSGGHAESVKTDYNFNYRVHSMAALILFRFHERSRKEAPPPISLSRSRGCHRDVAQLLVIELAIRTRRLAMELRLKYLAWHCRLKWKKCMFLSSIRGIIVNF